jgi:prephenate dehydrogenase
MAKDRIQHVTIIGVGLLGGSIGLALKARNKRIKVAGVGRRKESLAAARKVRAIDSAHLDAAACVGESDLVVLATPVGAFGKHLRTVAPLLKRGAIVTDVGSTKAEVVALGRKILGPRGPFVGSHPMAGSERKGPAFARADLFRGATCIITPTGGTPKTTATRICRFWESLGGRVVRMAPAAHDRAMADISHLPHVLAAAIMLLPREAHLDVSAGGLRDTTRLAAGDPEMWRDILLSNRKEILAALDRFQLSLCDLRSLIRRRDARGIEKFLTSAKKRRDATIGNNASGQ